MRAAELALEHECEGGGASCERCLVCDASSRLLLCHGKKAVGEAVGCAEVGHTICQPCLLRWFAAQQELLRAHDLQAFSRRTCPYCHCELRAASGGQRGEERYDMGMLKVQGAWP